MIAEGFFVKQSAHLLTGIMLPDLGFDPIAIPGEETLDRPDYDRGRFITVQFSYSFDQGVNPLGRGLEQSGSFVGLFDRALPPRSMCRDRRR